MKSPSIKHLPLGVKQSRSSVRAALTASGYVEGVFRLFYYCPTCKGWRSGTALVGYKAVNGERDQFCEFCHEVVGSIK